MTDEPSYRKIAIAGTWLPIVLMIGCGSPTSPSTAVSICPAGFVSKGSMSALIDGVPWRAGCVPSADVGFDGSLYVSGLDQPAESGQAQSLGFAVLMPFEPNPRSRPLVPGTYQFGVPLSAEGGDSYAGLNVYCKPAQAGATPIPCSIWVTTAGIGSGTVTITDVTSTTAKGTFSFNLLDAQHTSAAVKVVTAGVFDVMISQRSM